MLLRLLHIFRHQRQKCFWLSPWRPRRFAVSRRRGFGLISCHEGLERRLALSATEQLAWVGDSAAAADHGAHVWTLVGGAELLSYASSRRLSDAIAVGSPRLVEAVVAPSFVAVAARVFGAAGESAALSGLRAEVSSSGFSLGVQVVGGGVLGAARAAYASSDYLPVERIYVSADWLATADRSEIVTVLIEETGHAFDRRLSRGLDTPGDEGEWFAAIVTGQPLDPATLAAIRADDDKGEILLAGEAIRVEFSSPGDTPPVVNLVDVTKTVTENQAASLPFPNATVSDADSADFNGGLLLVRDLAAGDVVSIGTTTNNVSGAVWRSGDSLMLGNGTTSSVIGTISGGTNSSALSVVFSSSAVTPAVAQATLRAITFFNNSDAPVASRTLSVVLSDGDGGISAARTLAVAVTAVNDKPAISAPTTPFALFASTGTQADPSGGVGIALNDLFTGGRITDVDGTPANQLGVAITTIAGANTLKGFWFTTNGGTSWTLLTSANADTNAANAVFLQNTALTRIYFQAKNSQTAESLANVFSFRAWDGTKAAVSSSSTQTSITADIETSLSADTVSVTFNFVAGTPPVNAYPASYSVPEDTRLKLSGISVTDADNDVTSVRLSVSSGALFGASSGGVTVAGSGTGVLTLQGSRDQLNAFFASSATQPEFQSAADFNGTVTLGVLTSDSASLVDSDNVTITVTAVNDGPQLDLSPSTAGTGTLASFTEGAGAIAIAPQAVISDADSANLTSLTVTLVARPDGNSVEALSLTAAAASTASSAGLVVTYVTSTGVLTITGTASVATYQAVLRGVSYNNTSTQPTLTDRSISFAVSDGAAVSATATATVSLVNTNNGPTLVTALADRTVTSSLPFAFAIPPGSFVDPEGDTLTYRAALTNGSPLPGWLSFDAATQRFTGVGPAATGSHSIRLSAIDPLGQVATADFTVTVGATLNGQSVAVVSFPKVYELINPAVHSSSGSYMEETNSFTTGTPSIVGSNFVFYQAGVTRFSGNNVPGILAYIDGNGVVQEISGVASRPVKSPGNTVEGYYFWVDDGDENLATTGDLDNQAYLLVVNESYFQDGGSYNSSSDRVDSALNGYLDTATVSIADASAGEAAGSMQFTVTRSSGVGAATLFWATSISAGDTTSASDFTSASGTLSFADGQLTATITIVLVNDSFDEQDETFTVTLSGPSSNLRLGTATSSGTIIDDDSATVLSTANAGTTEGGAVVFVVTRTGTADVPQTVSYVTSIGAINTAASDDFSFTHGSVTFAPGETTKRISVQTAQDMILEANETFTFTLRDPTNGATLSTTSDQATGTIEDDESMVIYSVADATVAEGGLLTFTILRSGDVASSQTIDYATSNGAADTTSPSDFTSVSGSVTFLQGQLSRTVTVQTTADAVFESDETLTVTLSNLSAFANTKISDYRFAAAGTILDGNAVPAFTIAAASAEEGNTITFTVTRSGDAQATQSVSYASALGGSDTAATSDFAVVSGILSFASGEFTKTFTVSTTENTALDGHRTFTASLSSPTGGAVLGSSSAAAGTIRDDDGVFIEDGTAVSLIPVNQWLPSSGQTYAGLSFGFAATTVKDGPAERLRMSGIGSGVGDIPLDGSVDGGTFSLGAVAYSFTVSTTGGWTTISFALAAGGDLSVTQVNALLAAMTYVDLSQNPNGVSQREFSLAAELPPVADGSGGFTTDRVTISTLKVNVVPINDPPVSNNDSLTVGRGGTVTSDVITTAGAGLDTDVEGHALTIASVEGTAWGSLSVSADATYTGVQGYKSVSLSHGTLFIKFDGSVAYRHANADTVTQTFTYTVSDGNGGTSNSATVSITVTQTSSPVFVDPASTSATVSNYAFSYAENQSSTSGVLGTVLATDAGGGTVTYSITSNVQDASNNPVFAIDSAGRVTLTTAGLAAFTNNFEATGNIHVITVRASNGTNTTDIQVTLTETNVDDNNPVFTNSSGAAVSSYSFTYAENRTTTDVLGRVYAADADGDSLTFSITANVSVPDGSGGTTDAYAIDGTTGEITLTAAGVAAFTNNFEATGNSHQITVAVNDGSAPATTVQVTLAETNVDDNNPVFTNSGGTTVSSYSFSYAENRTTTDVLGQVYASDSDGDSLTFSITSNVAVPDGNGGTTDAYAIDSTSGEITLTAAGVAALTNNFEATGNSHQITVAVSYGSVPATTVHVTLSEANVDDNNPVFTNSSGTAVASYSFSYAENRTTTDVLGRVYASDADGESLTFSITANVSVSDGNGGTTDAYAIDSTTGEITLTAAGVAAFTNNFEASGNSHQITVAVSDGSAPATTVQVTLAETNVDDNNPVFTNSVGTPVASYSFSYAENRTTTDVLGRVYAADADGDSLTFSITLNVAVPDGNGGTTDAYAIDSTSGEITLTAAGVAAFTNNFEAIGNSHQITLAVSDGSVPATTVQVTLTETNVDDSNPVFTNSAGTVVASYAFTYAENRTTSDVLGRVYATDADGDSLTFSITSNVAVPDGNGGTTDAYAIDGSTGEITLTAAGVAAFTNDFEASGNSHQITAAVNDGSAPATTVQVTLAETNVDDNNPVFTNSSGTAVTSYSFSYSENRTTTDVLGRVYAADADGDSPTFSITSNVAVSDGNGGTTDAYAIDSTTGEITLTAAGVAAFTNNFEATGNSHQITVAVSDGSAPFTTVQVTLYEINVDDNSPVFTNSSGTAVTSFSFTYAENRTTTDVLGQVYAADADGDSLTFSITSNVAMPDGNGGTTDAYAIDSTTGEITLTAAGVAAFTNNFEATGNSHQITVAVSDGSAPATTVQVTLAETNVDDNNPVFTNSGGTPVASYSFSYTENRTTTDVLGRVYAADADGDSLTFSITANVAVPDGNGGTTDAYAISSTTGEITLTAAGVAAVTNNFETTGNSHHITVAVSDGSAPSTTVQVTLAETNVDDNNPVFTNAGGIAVPSYSFSYAENRTTTDVLGRVYAADADGDSLTFSITANVSVPDGSGGTTDAYAIDGTTGEITLTAAGIAAFTNNFEATVNSHQITVAVSDGSSPSTTVQVTLAETNVDDNNPVFTNASGTAVSSYSFSYAENRTTTDVLGQVYATDADGDSLTFSITANVSVPDGNSGTTDAYAIDGTTGEITLTAAGIAAFTNNFEATGNSHQITVAVSDGSSPATTVQVTLAETNVDDNNPVFKSSGGATVPSYAFTYAENRTTTDVLGRVYAADADGDSLTFSITANVAAPDGNGGTTDAYAIDSTTGEITLTAAGVAAFTNNFEATGNSHQITVAVSDGSAPATTVQVTLTETNVDDNNPVFTNSSGTAVASYAFTYAENRTTTDVLGRVYAADADGDSLTFSITANVAVPDGSGGTTDAYTIDSTTGDITLTAAGVAAFTNNFEATGNSHQITVAVSDGAAPATTVQVTLAETNVDDNNPVFTNSSGTAVTSYSFSYSENRTTTDILGQVYAADADGDSPTFSITSNVAVSDGNGGTTDAYAIDSTTGDITLTAAGVAAFTNNFEATGNSHQITVAVNDGSAPATTVQVTLAETNVDDNNPVFTNSSGTAVTSYSFSYSENRNTTDVLGRVYAADADGDSLTFSITANVAVPDDNGGTTDAYAIDSTTGDITLTAAGVAAFTNNFEATGNNHQITVAVSDGSAPATTVQVTLAETNVDDNNPVFTNSGGTAVASYSFSYAENRITTDVLGRVYAADADGDSLTFSITANVAVPDGNGGTTDAYAINSTTGEITLTAAGGSAFTNDYERATNARLLRVAVQDGNGLPTVSDVSLSELNVNDNPPVFTDANGLPVAEFEFQYPENRTTADVLSRIYASDQDGVVSPLLFAVQTASVSVDVIVFSITTNVFDGAGNPLFAINPATGEITLTAAGVMSFANDFEVASNTHRLVVSGSDGFGPTSTITVRLSETDLQDDGRAVDDAAIAAEAGGAGNNAAGRMASGNVLTNDLGTTRGAVAAVRTGGVLGQGTAGVVGGSLRGQFGVLTLQADGQFTYSPDDAHPYVEALGPGNNLVDSFNYTRAVGGSFESAVLRVTVLGANDSPQLVATVIPVDGIPANTGLPEQPAGRVGMAVGSLTAPASGPAIVTDVDAGSGIGFAIIGADQTKGTWWFSLNDGATWGRIGAVAADRARLLPASARLFFRPNRGVVGQIPAALTVRAWDQSSGVAGRILPVSALGSSLSSASGRLALRVEVPGVSLVDFDSLASQTVAAPAGDLMVKHSGSGLRTVSGMSPGARVTTIGSGSVRLLAPQGDLTLARGGTGVVRIVGLASSARLSLETSFGTVSFAANGQLLTRLTGSQALAIRRSVQIIGRGTGLTFLVSGTP